ncbi:MAG TPA: hypothetical protein VK806_05815 [Bacteroidia bacterium]|jgi:hypothetical protein|nr:hypothetical protein [Bacteroidia bacterium]
MKRILILSFLAASLSVSAQHKDSLITRMGADGINRVNIPGTKLFIAPPPGFKLAKNFLGLEKDDRNYIEVFAPYGDNFTKNTLNFTRLTFEGKGMDVFSYKQFNMNGFTAKYAAMKGNTGLRKYDLAFGDSSLTVMVVGYCQLNDDDMGKLVDKSVMSVIYDRTMKVDPYTNDIFSVTDSNSIFKFAKTTGSVYTYSIGGKPKVEYDGDVITILTVNIDNPDGFNMEQTMKVVYKDLGLTNIKSKKESTIKVNGQDATEIEVAAKENNNKVMLYEFYQAHDKKGVLMFGIARDDFDKNLDEFMKLSHTLKFK